MKPEITNYLPAEFERNGRRVWYIDVGQLSKIKVEQYFLDLMTKRDGGSVI